MAEDAELVADRVGAQLPRPLLHRRRHPLLLVLGDRRGREPAHRQAGAQCREESGPDDPFIVLQRALPLVALVREVLLGHVAEGPLDVFEDVGPHRPSCLGVRLRPSPPDAPSPRSARRVSQRRQVAGRGSVRAIAVPAPRAPHEPAGAGSDRARRPGGPGRRFPIRDHLEPSPEGVVH
jgi:hypothetical protein